MQLSGHDIIFIRGGAYAAAIAPSAGGRVASLRWSRRGLSRPLLVEWKGDAFDEHAWPKAGAFPMLPFANRMPRAGLRIDGLAVTPKPGPRGFALHGFAHRRPWSVAEATNDRAVLRLVHRVGDEAWPWAWSATQEICLDDDGMRVGIRVRNDSDEAMPLTIGWHPYHPLTATAAAATGISHDASKRYELDEEGRARPLAAAKSAFELRGEATIAYESWPGYLRLRDGNGGAIEVRSNPGNALVLHRPANGGYLCVEPVTSLPGHLTQLSPGTERQLEWRCSFAPDT